MLETLKDHETGPAFQQAYGKPLDAIEADLRAYISNGTLAAAVFDAPKVRVEEPRVEIAAGLAARLALAELQMATPGRMAAARAAYRQLSREYPNRWEVEAAVGEFDLKERRNSEAAEHLAIANELGARNPHLFVDYARALNLTGRGDQALTALRTALRLDPANDEAHLELGVALVRLGQYREAIDQFHEIRHLAPEYASRYYYNAAYAHYPSGDRARARALIREGRTHTKNPEELAALDRLREAVDRP